MNTNLKILLKPYFVYSLIKQYFKQEIELESSINN